MENQAAFEKMAMGSVRARHRGTSRPCCFLLATLVAFLPNAVKATAAEFEHRNDKTKVADTGAKGDPHSKPGQSKSGGEASGKHEKATPATAGSSATVSEPVKPPAEDHTPAVLTADDAYQLLIDGNKRYLAEKNSGSRRGAKRRGAVAAGQKPIALVVGCADSRVPPEIVFDQGLGDLFVLRTAGNLVDPIVLGSMEYAVEHLGVKLIVVLGHERCGAVGAAVQGGEATGNLKVVLEAINPAVERVKSGDGDLLPRAVRSNVKMVADKIRSDSKLIAKLLDEESVKIVGCTYDLDDGAVTLTYMP